MANPFKLPEYEDLRDLWKYAKEVREYVFDHIKDAAAYRGMDRSIISRYEGALPPVTPPPGYLAGLFCAIVEKEVDPQRIGELKEFLVKELNVVIRHNKKHNRYAKTPFLNDWDELRRLAEVSGKPGPPGVPIQRLRRADHFTGREKELAQLLADLQPGRVITLCGPGGIGKTALASEVVWHLAPGEKPPEIFPDGIICHDFYKAFQAALALEAIARAFYEEPYPTPLDAARRVLRGRRALLVLDGAENADKLPDVLSVAESCGVLLISRTTVNAVESWQELSPLAMPEAAHLMGAWGGMWATDDASVQAICELVGGLPLAIRLVGRYLAQRKMRAETYLKWLQASPLKALDQGNRRDESVPRLLLHCLAQVSEAARQVLAVIGLLALQPFDGAVIAAAFDCPLFEAEDRLGQLVSFGLLLRPVCRYEVSHALIHTYARDRLQPEIDEVGRLGTYFTELAKNESKNRLKGYVRLNEDRDHIMAVLAVCGERQKWQAAINLAQAVDHYLNEQGHWTDRVTANQKGAIAAFALGDWQSECQFLARAGRTWDVLGDEAEAIRLLNQALAISRELNDQRAESQIFDLIGTVYRHQGEVENAIRYYLDAQTIASEVNDQSCKVRSFCSLGLIYSNVGRWEDAIQDYQQARDIAQKSQDLRYESVSLGYLGLVYSAQGKPEKAIECYQKAYDIAKAVGDRRGEGNQLFGLGKAYDFLGEDKEANENYEQALAIAQTIRDFRMKIDTQAAVAHLSGRQGNWPEALVQVKELIRLYPDLGGSLWAYLKCYKVLCENGEPDAQIVLKTAYDLLNERARKINDEKLRHSFLHNVAVHKEIIEAFEKS